MAGLTAADVDVVYAHGTGTVLNDAGEAKAIRRAFDASTDQLKITSIKSMIGHGLGAAGAQSAVAAVCTLARGIVPPTINYTPDPALEIPIVGNVAQEVDAKVALVNAFGFGGQNVVAVFGAVN
jgi:3-oxoacyl-[acyl-carrier-protein] synthase II